MLLAMQDPQAVENHKGCQKFLNRPSKTDRISDAILAHMVCRTVATGSGTEIPVRLQMMMKQTLFNDTVCTVPPPHFIHLI